ncbi:MAG: LamG domain-containing protein [Candidatus Pacebacteria bacterium]|nr:LamG domain-containing protein [Candidatus Paceibacterota bacterium]
MAEGDLTVTQLEATPVLATAVAAMDAANTSLVTDKVKLHFIPGSKPYFYVTKYAREAAPGWTYDTEHTADANTILLLHLEDNAANTTVVNSGSGGNGATEAANTSTLSSAGKFNNGFTFADAEGISMTTEANFRIAGSMTVEAWIYPHAVAGYKQIVWKMYAAAGQKNYDLDISEHTAKRISFNRDNAAERKVWGDADLNTNQWYHVAGVFSKTTGMALFIDGVKQAQTEANTDDTFTNVTPQTCRIGKTDDVFGAHFDGIIDEVAVSNTVRYT